MHVNMQICSSLTASIFTKHITICYALQCKTNVVQANASYIQTNLYSTMYMYVCSVCVCVCVYWYIYVLILLSSIRFITLPTDFRFILLYLHTHVNTHFNKYLHLHLRLYRLLALPFTIIQPTYSIQHPVSILIQQRRLDTTLTNDLVSGQLGRCLVAESSLQ